MRYERIQVDQDTEAWHQLRSNSIGASDSPAIMGVSKWDTPRSLWKRKKGLIPAKVQTDSMREGKEREESIRHSFMIQKQIFVVPAVIQSIEKPYLIASLDGLSFDGDIAVEIKLSNKEDHECARNGNVPSHYFPQVQHQLYITGHEMMYYASLHGEELVIIEVFRNDEYITTELSVKLDEFWQYLCDNAEPAYLENEHLEIDANPEQIMTIQLYKESTTQIINLKKKQDLLKEQIVSWGDDGNIEFIDTDGKRICRLTRVEREGSVDWENLCKDLSITDEQLKQYRKPQIGYYKVS